MRKIITLLMCLGMACVLHAQAQKVTGMVLDAKTGEPLIGVSVLEVGTTNGIITDLDGHFTLSVQPNAKLQLSYVGYHPLEISASKSNYGVIQMEPEAIALEEIPAFSSSSRVMPIPLSRIFKIRCSLSASSSILNSARL